jgi:hypothetical protein
MNSRRFLIPRVAIRLTAVEDALADVGIKRLIGPGRLRQRRQANQQERGTRGREQKAGWQAWLQKTVWRGCALAPESLYYTAWSGPRLLTCVCTACDREPPRA